MTSNMRAVVAKTYTDPSGYELAQVPQPVISDKNDVLVRVHAASINPIDVKKAAGALKMMVPEAFPYLIGYDAAGVVEAVGEQVTQFAVGDKVFVRLAEVDRGSWSEYIKSQESYLAHMPKNLSFGDAASLPLAAMTALQVLRQYPGSLEGKTVFVPAGLSGTGLFACQLAKNVFRAGKVITTVSTAKVPLVSQLLGEGVVDQVIDYTKEDPAKVITRGSVDFLFDTTGQAMQFLSIMKPSTSRIVSVATTPSPRTMQSASVMQRPGSPRLPFAACAILGLLDSVNQLRARRWGVGYEYWFLSPNGKDLAEIAKYVEEGKLRTVVGSRVDIKDIAKVREACMQSYKGKGATGKTVFNIVPEV